MINRKYLEDKRRTKNQKSEGWNFIEKGNQFFLKSEKSSLEEENTTDADEQKKESQVVFSKSKDKIRITMLGGSGTGKTAFLSGVYQRLMSDPRTNIKLTVNDRARLNEAFATIEDIAMINARTGEVRNFALGTQVTTSYELMLCCDNKECCEFEFWDYRGGMVDDLAPGRDNTDETEVVALRKQLIDSDVILVFVDAIYLSFYADAEIRRNRCHARAINHIFTTVLNQDKKDVIIVVTKVDADKIHPEDKANNYQLLCEKANMAFKEIREKSKSFAIIPVSAVGEGKTETTGDANEGWKSTIRPNIESLEPINVDLVILYACQSILKRRIERWREEADQLSEEADALEKRVQRQRTFINQADKDTVNLYKKKVNEKWDMIDLLDVSMEYINTQYADEMENNVFYKQ